MRELFAATEAILHIAKMADCEDRPQITLTFNNPGDRERFQRTIVNHTAASEAAYITSEFRLPNDEIEVHGVRIRLNVIEPPSPWHRGYMRQW